jgi:hypothetical protein
MVALPGALNYALLFPAVLTGIKGTGLRGLFRTDKDTRRQRLNPETR